MKVERMVMSGQIARQARMRSSVFSWSPGPPHRLQHRWRSVLERHVDIGQHIAAVHQLDDLVDMRIGVDIVQAHPGAERAEFARRSRKRAATSRSRQGSRRIEVAAVGAGVLRNDDELLDAGLDQLFGFAQHVARRARDEVAAQFRNDAEGAAVVAALGDLEIGVVARRQLDALPGMRSTNGSCGAGAASCTAAITLSNACGPVIAATLGKRRGSPRARRPCSR